MRSKGRNLIYACGFVNFNLVYTWSNLKNITLIYHIHVFQIGRSCVCGYGNLEYDLPESERDVLVFLL